MVEKVAAVMINRKSIVNSENLTEAKRLFLEIYNLATEEPYSFLYVNLMKTDVDEMFMKTLQVALLYITTTFKDIAHYKIF